MTRDRRPLRGEDRAQRASSFAASAQDLQSVIRKTGFALHKLHELVMRNVEDDLDVAGAEALNDDLKPLIDALIHFEVRGG